ncbi:amine oxidase [Methanomicrobiaceae archaeon CYW5]|uniref:NAD(P)/FAD-dependent oxidoreductase n=1 Tax=Methanovulcanius yangii TaxID=1789227 RepID=UPI0029CA3046|nr:NAD(P)/FAD-dependent oxidoreductase [Methanovulcanius yangii]MBT8507010.1 amine oxidase [Methanovulcanius yangii]
MNICIIGGGLTGLTAAFALADEASVDVLEASSITGGLLSSTRVGDAWIENYYHHCFSGDRLLIGLMGELGIKGGLEWRKGSTGYYVDGTIHPLTTPLEILRCPVLTLGDKYRLARLTLSAKKYNADELDDVTARDFLLEKCGRHTYEAFFEPLLKSKFGAMRDQVSAAWMVSRIAIRSDRGPEGERLGYLKFGYHTLVDALVRAIREKGGAVHTGIAAHSVRQMEDGTWEVNGAPYDAVISTIRPSVLEGLGGPALPDIPYQGAACLTMGLPRDVTKGIYWVNMKDEAPYGAVIGHTNFIPEERYGSHIVYLASYFSERLPADHEQTMINDFCRRFAVRPEEIEWHFMTVDTAAGPVYTTGYRSLIAPYETDGLYMAGMFSAPNYPERSMEGSVAAGYEVAKRVMEGRA